LDHCELYRRHQQDISDIADRVGRASGLYKKEEREDFVQDCHIHFLKDECAALRRYRGDSSVPTYIKVIVENLLLDYFSRVLGKWRPSVKARALGEAAMTFERLIVRDGLSFEAACEIMLERGLAKTRAELEDLFAQLPPKVRRQLPDSLDDPDHPIELVEPGRPDADLERREREKDAAEIWRKMRGISATFPSTDRLALTLRFRDGLTISAIADLLNVNRKVFFRRFERLLETMREALVAAGIDEARVRDLLEHGLPDLPEDDWEQNA